MRANPHMLRVNVRPSEHGTPRMIGLRAGSGYRCSDSGQYMVEFALTFIIFIFIVIALINLVLIGYNYDTAQRACWEAARRAAVGASNAEIAEIVYNEFATKFYQSMLMVSGVEFGDVNSSNSLIQPYKAVDRAQGEEVTVSLTYKTGISLGLLGNAYMRFPIISRLTVIADNDEDRDGYVDSLELAEGYLPGDHDNNAGTVEGEDSDGDGIADTRDTGVIQSFGVGSGLQVLVTYDAAWAPVVRTLSDGKFASRMIYQMSDGDTFVTIWPILPRAVPADIEGIDVLVLRDVDLSYDKDNDGWEDKFDDYPDNPLQH